MFRHTGQKRNYKHNLRLATLLCLTAGLVNVGGLLAFNVFTTNVTGHAALLADALSLGQLVTVWHILAWLFLFLAGAFFSGICIRQAGVDRIYSYVVPLIVEITILLVVGFLTPGGSVGIEYLAGTLLFAMGLQNALVSAISGSVVRTTHLTGMFTDLGIDMAEMASDRSKGKASLKKRITLRLVIILSFILGGVIGGFIFLKIGSGTFYIAAAILAFAMFYDIFRVHARRLIHRIVLANTYPRRRRKRHRIEKI
ncbi:DUF1275 domain-containing protein [Parapedobacter sp. ISTM3]|uniref:YoaK family protein n=1 Tax=Parapedobacter sp. ISTM3 TaxID=2800130 RepID=UPI0019070720|nr:YoaK family protein [Parapedobacter sp. ISTM3]MBK1440824.1 DUF1275 domain-containing protein [Parapedobacter sp. ISTM3]